MTRYNLKAAKKTQKGPNVANFNQSKFKIYIISLEKLLSQTFEYVATLNNIFLCCPFATKESSVIWEYKLYFVFLFLFFVGLYLEYKLSKMVYISWQMMAIKLKFIFLLL